jgi:hypothetical protein
MRAVAVAIVLLLATAHGGRAEVQGGGLADTDCRMVFRGVTATNDGSGVVCTDGDATCDADGVADGTCSFAVRLCTGTQTSTCDTVPLSSASVAGLDLVPPRLPTFDGTCGPSLPVAVADGATASATVIARDGSSLRDVDYLDLCCVPGEPTALDAARCAVGVDLRTSGCPLRKIPRAARMAFARAHELVTSFSKNPNRVQDLHRALRNLAVVRRAAQHLAKHQPCGDALGLLVSYAQDVVGRASAMATRSR